MIRRSTWILLGIFLVLGVGAILWQRSQDQKTAEATPSPGASLLLEAGAQTISKLRITASTGGLIALEKDPSGGWILVNLPAETADGTRIGSVLSDITGMRILTEIETPPQNDVIGLEPPDYRLTIGYATGTEDEVLIGSKTTTQSGYYATLNGGPVVILNAFNVENVLKILTDPPVVKTPTPSPSPEGTSTAQP
jgi:hypothetical protein